MFLKCLMKSFYEVDVTQSLLNEFHGVREKRKIYKNLCERMEDQTRMDIGFSNQETCSEIQ